MVSVKMRHHNPKAQEDQILKAQDVLRTQDESSDGLFLEYQMHALLGYAHWFSMHAVHVLKSTT